MNKLFVLLLCLSTLATTASADLVVRQAYYRDTNLSLHIFLENNGTQSVTPLAPVVNGVNTAKLGEEGKTAGAVLWYRCCPTTIAAGEIADMTITLGGRPGKAVTVKISTAVPDQTVSTTVKCVPEPFRFQAIRFSADLRNVYVYLHWTDGSSDDSIKSILMDGHRLRKVGPPWPSRSADGLAYTSITLDEPVKKGSYHVFEAESTSGLTTSYQIRAIPAEFLIGVYGNATKANVPNWAAHGVNHYLSFGPVNADTLELLHSNGISAGAKYIPEPLVDRATSKPAAYDPAGAKPILQGMVSNPGLLYHHLVDEPDGADYMVDKRLGASAMELIARGEFCRQVDPERYTFVQLDNTFTPRNFAAYGEAADVLATHRYSLGTSGAAVVSSAGVRRLQFIEDVQDAVLRLRDATAPRPFFMVSQFFDLGPGRQGRPPTIEEMRIQCYAMIAGGARGIIHYIHSGSSAGHEGAKTPALWDAMTAMHEELKRVGEVIESGTRTPDNWVSAPSANVYASGIISVDKMAVVVINRGASSQLQQFTSTPARDVKIAVRVPAWIDASKLEVVSADGSKVVPSTTDGAVLHFTADEVNDARCFILAPSSK